MKDNVFSLETHVLCQSGNEEAPPTLALQIAKLHSRTSYGGSGVEHLISMCAFGTQRF